MERMDDAPSPQRFAVVDGAARAASNPFALGPLGPHNSATAPCGSKRRLAHADHLEVRPLRHHASAIARNRLPPRAAGPVDGPRQHQAAANRGVRLRMPPHLTLAWLSSGPLACRDEGTVSQQSGPSPLALLHQPSRGAAPHSAAPSTSAFEAAAAALDLARLTRWTVLAPGSWPEGTQDPMRQCPLGADGEAVVMLPCSTVALPCVFNRSTLEQALRASPLCPTCKARYAIPGPPPSGEGMSPHPQQPSSPPPPHQPPAAPALAPAQYSGVNSVLNQLHRERVAAGARPMWRDDTDDCGW